MENFFTALEQRENPWPPGRRDLHWHLLPDTDLVREQLVDPYADLTRMNGLEPVAAQWLHVTLLHSGPVTEATDAEVEQITQLVRERAAQIAPFDLTFLPPAVGRMVLECIASPREPALRLWEMIWQATTDVVGDRWPRIPARFYPHASIAYAGPSAAKADRKAMKIWLSDHAPRPVTLPATQLSLVAQWHDGRRIIWDHLTDVPLGGAT